MSRPFKKYKIVLIDELHMEHNKVIEGDCKYLAEYFKKELTIAHNYNPKINDKPNTISSLISSVNRAYNEIEKNLWSMHRVERID